jgi:hypothetical protein
MMTDTLIRNKGMQVLVRHLGMVEAEQFIMLIQKEPFDYTKWRESLFEEMSIDEINERAARFRERHPTAGVPTRSARHKVRSTAAVERRLCRRLFKSPTATFPFLSAQGTGC